MKKYYEDKEFLNIVNDIINHSEVLKMKDIVHHQGSRYDHCLRVSYKSYRIAKKLKLDYRAVARAGLLHDFFFEDSSNLKTLERMHVLFNHSEYACINSKRYFELSELEENIIKTHMFPIGKKIPKYFESWLVDFVDDGVSIYEEGYVFINNLSTAMCFLLIFLINNLG